MTDAQIQHVYNHPADDRGQLVPPREPKKPLTLEEELALAAVMMANLGVSALEQEKGFEVIRRAHQGG